MKYNEKEIEKQLSVLDYTKYQAIPIIITPELAQYWLDNQFKNRPKRKAYIKNIAEAIKNDKWELNGDTIAINTDGVLVNGQHRLSAIVMANKSVTSLVATGVKTTTFTDNGNRRKPKDVFLMNGLAEDKSWKIQSCCLAVTAFLTNRKYEYDRAAMSEWMDAYNESLIFIYKARCSGGNDLKKFFSGANFLGAMFVARENGVPEDVLMDWYNILRSGLYSEKHAESVIRFRNEIQTTKRYKEQFGAGGNDPSTKPYQEVFLKCQYSIYNYWKKKYIKTIKAQEMFPFSAIRSNDAIPEGKYNVVVKKLNFTTEDANTYLSADFQILDGKYQDKKLFDDFIVRDKDPEKMRYGWWKLTMLARALGYKKPVGEPLPNDTEWYIGKTCEMSINGDNRVIYYNEIK